MYANVCTQMINRLSHNLAYVKPKLFSQQNKNQIYLNLCLQSITTSSFNINYINPTYLPTKQCYIQLLQIAINNNDFKENYLQNIDKNYLPENFRKLN